MAADEVADLVALDAKLTKIKAELKAAVLERSSSLMDIYGVGPVGAARVLADVGDVARFADPGPGQHLWTPHQVSRPATGCPVRGTHKGTGQASVTAPLGGIRMACPLIGPGRVPVPPSPAPHWVSTWASPMRIGMGSLVVSSSMVPSMLPPLHSITQWLVAVIW